MNREGIYGGRRSRLITDLLRVARPSNRKSLMSPDFFEKRTIRPLRSSVDRTRNIWQPHLDGIGGRPLGLFSRRIAQSATGCTHVPEISPDQVTLGRIVVKYRRQRRIGMRLRFT